MPDESAALADTAGTPTAPPIEMEAQPDRARSSYREILRSSALIGGSSAVNLCIGVVRTKLMALMLGPSGYGLMGAYVLVGELTRNVAQLGINASGVRQIAEAVASEDQDRVARTARVLRFTSLGCALLGAASLALLAGPVSQLTFGTGEHAGSVALMSVAVFFSIVAAGQGALLQGMRRIADIARLTIIGSLLGTVAGMPIVYAFGADGLVPTLIVVAAGSLLASWWYSRRIRMPSQPLQLAQVADEASALLRLGFAFMASGLLVTGAAYVVRTIVLRQAGVEAAGIYYAAWTLGGLYLGFVLQALGTDFYPRLVGVIGDHEQCNRLVNEQAYVSLLLAIPGILATLTLAPLVITLFYSSKFAEAVDVLRWLCLGMAMRVLTWPIGSIVVAKNRQLLFIGIDLAWTVANIALTWWLVRAIGVNGAGVAFAASYLMHGFLVYPIARWLTGFRWQKANLRVAAASFVLVGLVFLGFLRLPAGAAVTLGILATIVSAWVSATTLMRLARPELLPRPLRLHRSQGGTS